MGLLHDLKLRFTPPRLSDPEFGELVFMFVPNARDKSYWEAQWSFPATGTTVSIDLLGGESGPLPEARSFYLDLARRFPDVLTVARPVLDDVFRHWYGRPIARDVWHDVKLAGLGLDDPHGRPLQWQLLFEATGEKWLGITIPFRDEVPGEPVVDT